MKSDQVEQARDRERGLAHGSIGARFVAVVRTALVMSVSFRVLAGADRGSAGGYGPVGLDADDRDQRQADVAHLLEQAMQRRLVGDGAMDDVVPSLSRVRLSPSNQAAHRASRCPLRRSS